MLTVSFVCLGNICRSPMAHAVFEKLVGEAGLSQKIAVLSFATSDWERGCEIYPPAARMLERNGVHGFTHRSTPLTPADITRSDYVLVMDKNNLADVKSVCPEGEEHKIYMLGSFASPPRVIADPYYTRDFQTAYSDISQSCAAFLQHLIRQNIV